MKAELLLPAGKGTPLPIKMEPLALASAFAEETGWGFPSRGSRERELEQMLSELTGQVHDLRRQLAQWEQGFHSKFTDEDELHEMVNDVERERQALDRERQQLEEERRQFLEEKQDVRQMLGQMEAEMAQERAEHHRQQTEMKRQEDSLRIARGNLAREKLLAEAGLRPPNRCRST